MGGFQQCDRIRAEPYGQWRNTEIRYMSLADGDVYTDAGMLCMCVLTGSAPVLFVYVYVCSIIARY